MDAPPPRRTRYTLAEVLESYPPEKHWSDLQGALPDRLLYRPLSFRLTPFALRLGLHPNHVTLFALLLSLAMPLLAWKGEEKAYLGVFALGVLYHVLDCVDGNMARVAGLKSRLGALLEPANDFLFWSLLLLSLGILAEKQGGSLLGGRAVELGLAAGALVLWSRIVRDSYASIFGSSAVFEQGPPPTRLSGLQWLKALIYGLEYLYVWGVLIGGLCGRLDLALVVVASCAGVLALGSVALTFEAALRAEPDPS